MKATGFFEIIGVLRSAVRGEYGYELVIEDEGYGGKRVGIPVRCGKKASESAPVMQPGDIVRVGGKLTGREWKEKDYLTTDVTVIQVVHARGGASDGGGEGGGALVDTDEPAPF